ncbi:pulmonary surfactant-associated protein A-like [Branchiostoma lanceolatum]|uniref:pulmonary surfactant-associated protein A-like n=1 Tax=Branchiostoma lanceolatum TaxID=7740 RepID=UPI0034566614
MTFDDAETACGQFGGGRLAQPTTDEFNDQLMGTLGEVSADGSFWIGLKMFGDFWSWSDGTPSKTSYSSWAPGEPSGEGCVTMTSAGEWRVKNCKDMAFYVCQIGK